MSSMLQHILDILVSEGRTKEKLVGDDPLGPCYIYLVSLQPLGSCLLWQHSITSQMQDLETLRCPNAHSETMTEKLQILQ